MSACQQVAIAYALTFISLVFLVINKCPWHYAGSIKPFLFESRLPVNFWTPVCSVLPPSKVAVLWGMDFMLLLYLSRFICALVLLPYLHGIYQCGLFPKVLSWLIQTSQLIDPVTLCIKQVKFACPVQGRKEHPRPTSYMWGWCLESGLVWGWILQILKYFTLFKPLYG